MSTIAPPFRVKAVSGEQKFVPLAMEEPMSINEILENHPKGIDYAHLLDGFNKFPVIIDSKDNILSFPPIINGNQTTVTASTKDFFIDVTGWDFRSCEASLMLIALQLQELGGSIESVNITNCDGVEQVFPNGKPVEHVLPTNMLDGLLGRELNEQELTKSINRMGGKFISKEAVVLITLMKKNAKQKSNVVVRGTSLNGFALRPQVIITKGRKFTPGTNEIVIGSAIASEPPFR